jgi:hypothetical protein
MNERWKQFKDAGRRRWTAEIVLYSGQSNKRVLGENLLSKKFKAQKIEARLKVCFITNSWACKLTSNHFIMMKYEWIELSYYLYMTYFGNCGLDYWKFMMTLEILDGKGNRLTACQ